MSTVKLIRASLESVRSELLEPVNRLTDDLLPWAPASGMRTIQGQIVEVMGTEIAVLNLIKGGEPMPEKERDAHLWAATSVGELQELLASTRAATLAHLESLDEERVNQAAWVYKGFAAFLRLQEVPVAELFRFIAIHESYHAGQLVSYLWTRGDDPYKW